MAKNVVPMAVKKAAPAPAPAKPKAPPAKPERTARYVGATSGLSVVEYQNKTLAANFRAKLTDEQLAETWREEFPRAVAYTEKHVAGVRNAWNRGKHGQDAPPPKKLHPYDEAGNELPLIGDKAKAAAKVATKAPAKTAKTVAQVATKKVIKKVAAPPAEEVEEEA